MSASRRRRFIPVLDQLEHRNLLAGNITTGLGDGTINIWGDAEVNQIKIVDDGHHNITITPLDDTTINGVAGPVTFSGIRKGIGVDLKEGDDVLQIENVHLRRGLNIDLGDGNDTLTITGSSAGKTSGMMLGEGDDNVTITGSVFEKLQLQGAAGNDSLSATGNRTGRNTTLDGGEGDNSLGQSGNRTGKRTDIKNWGSVSNGTLPTAVNDTATVNKSASLAIDVASNDTTSAGTIDETSIVITTAPTHGTATVNNDGTITYTHNGDTFANDTLQYTIKNSSGATSNTATVNITINQGPTASNDTGTVSQVGNVTIDVAANDTASMGTLDLTSIVITTQPTHGTLVVNNDGTVKYTNNGDANTSDSFVYTIKDSLGAVSNTATVTITVGAGPTAVADAATVIKSGNINVNVAGNDTTPNGTLDLTSIVITTAPTHGTAVANADGTVKYTHNGNTATADTFSYTIKNSLGGTSNIATVTMKIDQGPVANNDAANVAQVGTVVIPVSSNDSTVNGTLDLSSIVITTQPTNGTLTNNNDGTIQYVHNGSATTSDSFAYTIKNTLGAVSNIATVTITVGAGPAALPDVATLLVGATKVVDVLTNDTTPSGTIDLTSVEITTQPAHGTATPNADGTVSYTHNGDASTTDTFSYRFKNSLGGFSNIALVTLTITAA